MTISYFSRDDAEKAWNELPPEEKSKTKIVKQPSYYLLPYNKDDELINEMHHLVQKGDYEKAMKIAGSISDEKRSLRAQTHVMSYLIYPEHKGE